MRTLKSCILLFLGTLSPLLGEIIETPHFCDINSHIDENTLVLLDIDDTVLIHAQMLGCDEWFLYRNKALQKEEMSVSEALEKAVAEYDAIHHLTKMEIVEPGTEAIIDTLQKTGHTVMGLTTRGLGLATRTVQQLKEKGIDLSRTSPGKEEAYIQINGHGVIYRKGVFLTSGTHKGEALFQLCERIGYQPKRILFINDKATHLREIEASANQRNIPFIGLRYAYSDARKAAFRPEIADFQFTHSNMQHILSDAEAKAIMEAKN